MNTPPWNRDLDAELKKIALEAQRHQPKSRQRRKAIRLLWQKIWESGQLCRPKAGVSPRDYEEIYATACHDLFLYISKNIQKYNRDREVLQWVNFLLRNNFFRAAFKELKGEKLNSSKAVTYLSYEELDAEFNQQMQQTHSSLPSQQILELVREDPDRQFSSTYVTRRPDANFQYIFLQKSQGYTWKDIAKSLDMPQSTLSSFFQKWLKLFEPIFQEYLTD